MNDIADPQNSHQKTIDTLLVSDPKSNSIKAVSKIDHNGRLKTVLPTLEHQNQFLQINVR